MASPTHRQRRPQRPAHSSEDVLSFGAWLRQQRRALDLTQDALARRVGCARITIRRIEADELKPSRELALLLASHLGLSAAQQEAWLRAARGVAGQPAGATGATLPPSTPGLSVSEPSAAVTLPSFLQQPAPFDAQPRLFVAREPELAQLQRWLDLAGAGQGRVAFVTGEAGSGKSTLVQEFARRAQQTDPTLVVATGSCQAFAGIGDPYLPFRELLALLTGDVEARWAAGALSRDHAVMLWSLLPQVIPLLLADSPNLIDTFLPGAALLQRVQMAAPTGAPWVTQLAALVRTQATAQAPRLQQPDLFAQTTRLLLSIARRQLLLLILDDLQWADAGSLHLLFHLGRQLAGSRILLLGLYRPADVALGRPAFFSDQPSATAATERHPLASVVAELQRTFSEPAIDLQQADGRTFIGALLASLPHRLRPTFAVTLYQHTEGQALFTVELLRALQLRGDLVHDEQGVWVEGPTLNWETLPVQVEGIIGERIGRLSPPLQTLLTIAAVEGESFTAETIAGVQGISAAQVVGQLSNVLDKQQGLVRLQEVQHLPTGRLVHYRFRHHLFQKYLYQRLDAAERTYLHAEVGLTLEALYGDQTSEIALDLALHFGRAGHVEQAVKYWLGAAQQALRLSAHEETIAHCQQGLTWLASLPHTTERAGMELTIQLTLGMAFQALKGYSAAEAETAYQRALELYREFDERPDLVTQLVPVLIGLGGYYLTRSRWPEALEIANRTLRLAEQSADHAFLTSAYWLMGYVFSLQGLYAQGRVYLEKGIGLSVPDQPHMSLHNLAFEMWCLTMSAIILWILGFPDQARLRALAVEEAVRHRLAPQATAAVLVNLAVDYQLRDDAASALRLACAALPLAKKYHQPYWTAAAMITSGWAKVALGAANEGLDQIRQGMALQAGVEHGISYVSSLLLLGKALASTRQYAEALGCMTEAIAVATADRLGYYQPELYRLKGELLLMQIPPQGALAEEAFLHAITIAQRQEAKMYELRATVSLCRLWQRQGKSAEAHEWLATFYAWFTEGFDTPDLQAAKTLLLALADPQSLA